MICMEIHSTYFISGGVEVSAIYIDQDQISSLWYLRGSRHKKVLAGVQVLHPNMLPDVSR